MGFSGKGSKNAGKTGLNPCAFLRMRFYGMKTAGMEKSVLVKCRGFALTERVSIR
jgi:hypothetical protein